MRNVFVLSFFILSVAGEHIRRESDSSEEEMDDRIIPRSDPIWWFIRSLAEELWLSQLGADFPQIAMFGEEEQNFLQFILHGELVDIDLVLEDCPDRLFIELSEMRQRAYDRNQLRYMNDFRQNFGRFNLNRLFDDRRFADEQRLEVYDLSRLFSNQYI